MHGGEHVVAVAGGRHARAPTLEHVAQRVAGYVDLALDAFGFEVAPRSQGSERTDRESLSVSMRLYSSGMSSR